MKSSLFILLFFLFSFVASAQDKEAAEKVVGEGVELHDKGDYEGAIKKYDEALKIDKDNVLALAEKALTLVTTGKYNEAIVVCEKAIEAHPGHEDLAEVYTSYGTALDNMGKSSEALRIYDVGIAFFPNNYMLHFNKGISYSGLKQYDKALACFETSVSLNPDHAGSHNAIARVHTINNNRIPAILGFCRFLVVEPEGRRAVGNLEMLQKLMGLGVEKTGKKSVSINLSEDMFGDTTATGENKENNFSTVDMLLSLSTAMNYDKKYKKDTDVKHFIRNFESVCAVMKETKDKNSGFYWEYYAPYFIELNDKGFLEPFAYIVFASSSDASVGKWIQKNGGKIEEFYAWSNGYVWR